ncbi:MAG: hypothetical protein Q7Q71_07405 [Verrucomicrobiota bacterium JB023]|nr:hypothetical protein [Verrucomicrobiota bacterium JB023]
MNAWEALGLKPRLALADGELEEKFRERMKGAHPDAGGGEGEFEAVQQARDLLADPGRRLEAWLKARGVEISHSGAVPPEVGEMFMRVGTATSGVDQWLEKGKATSSGLGKALWQKEGFQLKESVEQLIGEVEEWEERVTSRFALIEEQGDNEAALLARGELGFLRKWKAELRGRYGKLWEGLV